MLTPNQTRASPAMTVPVTLAGAESPLMSSHSPTTTMIAAASSTPCGSELRANSASKRSRRRATTSATTKPMNIARPPMAGIGDVCTVRSLGS